MSKTYEIIDSSRVLIVTDNREKDGIIELRKGVDDISIGDNNYSSIRILLNSTHYAAGMAIYSEDIPSGYDVVIYTYKYRGIKPFCDRFDVPIKESHGVINIVADSIDWGKWKQSFSEATILVDGRKAILKLAQLGWKMVTDNTKLNYRVYENRKDDCKVTIQYGTDSLILAESISKEKDWFGNEYSEPRGLDMEETRLFMSVISSMSIINED